MHRIPKLATLEEERRLGTVVMVGAVLVVLGVGYLVLLMHPELVRDVGAFWTTRIAPSGSASWTAPTFAAGVAIGGAAIGVYVLSSFVRGVQRTPYTWLAPVLVGFSYLVLSRSSIELPINLTATQFAAVTSLLWLGGGALMQQRRMPARISGALLLTLPVAALVAAWTQVAGGFELAWVGLSAPERFFSFVLILTWLGIAFMSLATQDLSAGSGQDIAATRDALKRTQERLSDVLEHARLGELNLVEAENRAQRAEQQAAAFSHALGGSGGEDAFASSIRPRVSLRMVFFLMALSLALLGAAAYFAIYAPMAKRLSSVDAQAAALEVEHEKAISAIHEKYKAQQAELTAAAEAAREEASSAEAKLDSMEQALEDESEPSDERSSAQAQERPSPQSARAAAASKRRAAAAAKARAKAQAKAKARARKKAAAARQREQREAAAAEGRALPGGEVDNDPIGGLF